jgi:cytochrome b561
MAHLRNAERYDPAARGLHWITVALVIFLVVTGKSGVEADEPSSRMFFWHSSLGVLLLCVLAARVGWALFRRGPAMPASMSRMTRMLAHATHVALYLLLFALSVSGWLAASAEGGTVSVFGAVSLPRADRHWGQGAAIVVRSQHAAPRSASAPKSNAGDHDSERAENAMGELHETLGNLLLMVAGLHILAALVHQFYWRDGLLERMLPSLRERGTTRDSS